MGNRKSRTQRDPKHRRSLSFVTGAVGCPDPLRPVLHGGSHGPRFLAENRVGNLALLSPREQCVLGRWTEVLWILF